MKAIVIIRIVLLAIIALAGASSAWAANECKISYGWNTGNTLQGNFKNHTKTLSFDSGQTRTINRSRMNYVENLKSRQAKFFLNNANDITLDKNQRNPAIGSYLGNVKLVKVKCLSTSTSSNQPASPAQLIETLKAQGVGVGEIARQLRDLFGQTADQIALLLKNAGFNATQVAEALKIGINANAEQIAAALKSAFAGIQGKTVVAILKGLNFGGLVVLKAIDTVFAVSNLAVARAMRLGGYSSDALQIKVAGWLKTAWGASRAVVSKTMLGAGYSLVNITKWLLQVENRSLDFTVSTLKAAGVKAVDLAQAVANAGGSVASHSLAVAMRAAGWSARNIMNALKTAYQLSDKLAARAFNLAQFSAAETADALKFVFKLSRSAAQIALQFAGYSAQQIQAALNAAYGKLTGTMKNLNDTRKLNVTQGMNNNRSTLANQAVAAAAREISGWLLEAQIGKRYCRVNGPVASAGPGVLQSGYRWRNLVSGALQDSGVPANVAEQWDRAYRDAFIGWANKVSIPSLPWYPSLSLYAGARAAPTPNVPTPIGSLTSAGLPGMSAARLGDKITNALGKAADKATRDAVSAFAGQIDARFTKLLASGVITGVLGEGPVPGYSPPKVPAAPVVSGFCQGKGVLASSAAGF